MDIVKFSVNDLKCSVSCEVSSTTTLLDYLRHTLELRGTKYMCLEGGCGACIVNAVKSHGEDPQGINSCMVSITSCHGWDINTIENLGNRLKGYHKLQITLAEENGSQCGYCSPGMVMNIYSQLRSKKLTMLEIEKSLGSNICRCTGYRPILHAFKKFAVDAPQPIALDDIEDLTTCEKSGESCSQETCEYFDWCFVSINDVLNKVLHIKLCDDRDWYRANTLSDVFGIWQKHGVQSYMLVAGNTAKGVYPIQEYPKLLIDVTGVLELKGHYIDQNLVVGAGSTLTDVINIFKAVVNVDGFSYLNVLIDHLQLVANGTIRNIATLAGNLIIKNRQPDFKSDIYMLLETIQAEITILTGSRQKYVLSMSSFRKKNMVGGIILNVKLPPLSGENKILTYKIMPRFQNAHALVQAGFLYNINSADIVRTCRIVYGGLSSEFTRAFETERYLYGKKLFSNVTLQGALQLLNKEVVVSENLLDTSVLYRQKVALGLFYKSLLTLCSKNILDIRYHSGAINLRDTRPVSKGSQKFETNPALWPLNKPIPKIEGLIQTAGEAKYTDDIPTHPEEVFVAFVLAKVPLAKVKKIDPSKALEKPGVLAFYSASDIPGNNNFMPPFYLLLVADELLFPNKDIKYYDQPVGVVVAKSRDIAKKAAALVEIQYTDIRKPVVDIKEAINDPARVTLVLKIEATNRGNNVVKVIKGNNTIYGQYHFSMETIICFAHPTEEGLRVYSTTQAADVTHQAISKALNLDQSRVDVHVRRLGGSYGFKLTRSVQAAAATALVAYKLNLPSRLITPLNVNMRALGKRFPCFRDFEVGVNSTGEIQYINTDLYSDNGYIITEVLSMLGIGVYSNCYKSDSWKHSVYNVVTDTAANTWCRSPGTLENIAMVELMIERIAYELNLDPLEVRLRNVDDVNHTYILEMTETLKNSSHYDERKIAVNIFNENNRWKKRGLRFCFMRWTPFGAQNLDVNMSVYMEDGTVVITHGGVEMGQGINTKAIQICAYLLNIPVEKIQIKSNNTINAPNSTPTGGSVTTQSVLIGIRRCCEKLLQNLQPVRSQMSNPTWVELIKRANELLVDLQVHAHTTSNDAQNYNIYGVSLAEVEIDVLTGEWQIIQVDLTEDVGQSVNPLLDVGQVEGAFMMGVGYWTCENLVHDSNTGEVLTDRTWEYWVPQAMDIPQIFNVYFKKRSYSNDILFGAKATGEPATCMGIVIALAMREAIAQARQEVGIPTTQWFDIDGPFTVDKICVSAAARIEDFKFN